MTRLLTALGLAALLAIGAALPAVWARTPAGDKQEGSKDLLDELKSYPHKLVYETNRDGNWEL